MSDPFLDRIIAEGAAEKKAEWIAEGKARGIAEGKAEGKAEGIAEGIIEEKKNTAKRLRDRGWSVEEIAEFEKMPVVDIEIWLNEE